jgi:hypothetical protein
MSTRAQLRFGILGLPAREEMLFKSFVRLLDNRSLHQWHYLPQMADLWVVAPGIQPPSQGAISIDRRQVLTVSDTGNNASSGLRLPLDPLNIEAALNQLGSKILSSRVVSDKPATAQRYPESYRLARWPRVNMLDTKERMRMATLLLGKPLTIDQLADYSCFPVSVCEGFVQDLKTTGLVQIIQIQSIPIVGIGASIAPHLSTEPITHTAPVSSGLFARIRNALALKKNF